MARATVSRELLNAVGAAYELSPIGDHTDLEDSFNLNVVVWDGDRRLVVRVYRPAMTVSRLEAVQRVRQFLVDGGLPFARLRRTSSGDGWCRFGDRLVEVEEFVPSETYMESFEHIRLAMPVLARIHDRLHLMPPDEAAATASVGNHVEAAGLADLVAGGIAALRREGLTAAEREQVAVADALARQLQEEEAPYVGQLPRQLVHGDYWDDNVKLTGTRVSLVTDLDFMGERPRIDDLALTLFYTNERLGRADISYGRFARLRELVDAYDATLGDRLSAVERRALPYAIARTSLCFIADWMCDPGRASEVLARRGPAWSWALSMINTTAWTSVFTAEST